MSKAQCPLCLEPYVDNRNLAILRLACSHRMHKKCLKDFVQSDGPTKDICPECRQPYAIIPDPDGPSISRPTTGNDDAPG
ncbi:hypothetical protein GCK72_013300 [Caenorhabditis remanei]|uniref:RING-type domain-containing protein n=1 Tax=Caenorhabditis remanei TaxID=31234 RepID=A0A6A5GQN8_CAERE|nr:hypothetical protein GCK72_013300 [Caenorhabditis remanei]KAF1756846.1 hypothetical protein GCK72_013300 [Caenorhabditis remanei]